MCYYTAKNTVQGLYKGSCWPQVLDIWLSTSGFFDFAFIFRHLYLNRNLVELDHFIPLLAYWLHQNSYNWLIWWFIDLQMIPMSHLIGQFNILGPQGVHFWRKCWNKVGNDQFCWKIRFFSRFWVLDPCFSPIFLLWPPNIELPNQVASLVSFGGLRIIK